MLVSGQPAHAAALEQLGQRVVRERGGVGADLGVLGVKGLELTRARVVVVAARS